jgi:hypothetical protein
LIAALLILAGGPHAFGWNGTGHKIIGSLAARQLSPAQQATLIAILKNHPRFKEDFESKMPDELKAPADQAEWLFQQASAWPDMVRSGDESKAFHHPSWHYINAPYFLTHEDQLALQNTQNVNISLDPPATETDDMNVVQAIRYARRFLAEKDASDAKKAVMLCWLMHDVGDLHQPLHAAELFSKSLFPRGDRGGNLVPTDQHQNLHSLWDSLIGDDASFRNCRNKAIAYMHDANAIKVAREAVKSLDEKRWLEESHELAVSVAYGPEVSGHLRAVVNQTEVPPIRLSETYLTTAGGVAEGRVIQAGARLGPVLKQIAGEQ